jgi:hypothetical protein
VSQWGPAHRAVAGAVADALGLKSTPALGGPVDWDGFVRLAGVHQVGPLVRRSLWLSSLEPPAAAVDRLHRAASRSAGRSMRAIAVLGEVLAALGHEEIDALVVGGLPLAAWAYRDVLARQAGAVEVLVDPRRLADAARVLVTLGFELIPVPSFDGDPDRLGSGLQPSVPAELNFARNDTFVDLRGRLFPNRRLLPIDAFAREHRRTVDLGNLVVPTLSAEASWWYTTARGTRDGWPRLQLVADVPAILTVCPGLVDPPALARANRMGVARSVSAALQVAEVALGPFVAAPVRAWVAGVDGTAPLVRHGLRRLFGYDRRGPSVVDAVAAALAQRGDVAYRGEEVRIALINGARSSRTLVRDAPALRSSDSIRRSVARWSSRIPGRHRRSPHSAGSVP